MEEIENLCKDMSKENLTAEELTAHFRRQAGFEKDDIKDRDSFEQLWSTEAYLEDFYTRVDEPAMKMILIFLPNVVARLPAGGRLLDVGSGPTVHVAACFRKHKDEIYLSDYLPRNRESLVEWVRGRGRFDWSTVYGIIGTQEGDCTGREAKKMDLDTRRKIRGVLSCNIFRPSVIPKWTKIQSGFDVVTTVLCVEYACRTEAEYRDAIKNLGSVVKPGGHFIMGGILEETWCCFGGVNYTCLYLTEKLLLEALEDAGISTKENFLYYVVNGIFLLCGEKRKTNTK